MRNKNRIFPFLAIIILVLSLPLTLILINKLQDYQGSAAAADKLETESGTLGSGATAQTDSQASGGIYVALGVNQTPTPTPSQSSVGPRPAPSTPTGSNVYTVPASIDGSGNTEVGAALRAWIATLPNGTASTRTIIVFPAGKTYKVDDGITLNGRHFLSFWGYGSKIKMMATQGTSGVKKAAFGMSAGNTGDGTISSNIKILGFEIEGSNPVALGPGPYYKISPWLQGINEGIGAVMGYGNTDDVEVADNYIHATPGDAVYTHADTGFVGQSDRWYIHHNLFEKIGRQGIVPSAGDDYKIEWNIFRDIGNAPIDAEDGDNANYTIRRLHVNDNLIERWAWNLDIDLYLSTGGTRVGTPPSGTQGYFTANGFVWSYDPGGRIIGTMEDIYVERNTFRGGPMGFGSTDYGKCNNDNTVISVGFLNAGIPKSRVYVRDNRIEIPIDIQCGSGIRVVNATGGEITGNYLPGMTIGTYGDTGFTINHNTALRVGTTWPN